MLSDISDKSCLFLCCNDKVVSIQTDIWNNIWYSECNFNQFGTLSVKNRHRRQNNIGVETGLDLTNYF